MKEFVYATRYKVQKLNDSFNRFLSDRRGSVSCPPFITVIIGGILGLIVGAVIAFSPETFVGLK